MNADLKPLLLALAMRPGSSYEPAMQRLLEQAGMDPAVASNPQEMVAQLSEKDPALAILAQCLANSREEQNAMISEVPDRDEEEQERSRKMGHAVKRLQHIAEDMYAELEQLRNRNDRLAAALGACYLCWGEDPQCEVCGGMGRPGTHELDLKEFAELVKPVLRRIRNDSSRSKREDWELRTSSPDGRTGQDSQIK